MSAPFWVGVGFASVLVVTVGVVVVLSCTSCRTGRERVVVVSSERLGDFSENQMTFTRKNKPNSLIDDRGVVSPMMAQEGGEEGGGRGGGEGEEGVEGEGGEGGGEEVEVQEAVEEQVVESSAFRAYLSRVAERRWGLSTWKVSFPD